MKKILITGSLGLVGSEALAFYKKKGWEVVGIDNNMRAKLFGVERISTFERISNKIMDIDIRDEEHINHLFKTFKGFDAIIHTAAQPSHDYSTNNAIEDFKINALGTLILLEATRKYCPKATFVHISTDKVYGENMGIKIKEVGMITEQNYELRETDSRFHAYDYDPVGDEYAYGGFDEDTSLDFAGKRSLFGCSKTAADIYVQEYGNYFGMKTVCFRAGCITGKNHKGAELHGFLSYLAKCIKEGKAYTIFGYKGKQVRDQIHAYDLITACDEFIQNPKCGAVYNIGGGEERSVSVLEAIDLIEKETGKEAIYRLVNQERKGDRIWDIHDVSKFRADYPNWDYKYSLSDIIKDICIES